MKIPLIGVSQRMWCVISVKDKQEAQTESLVAGLLPKTLNARCFHLTRSRRKKFQGQWQTVHEDLFPGYVFIDTDQPERVYKELKKAPRPRLLFSSDAGVSAMEPHESDFMEKLTDQNGVINLSKVKVQKDGTIEYLSGPLVKVKDRVQKINLHKRVAELETSILGQKKVLYLGIDIEQPGG